MNSNLIRRLIEGWCSSTLLPAGGTPTQPEALSTIFMFQRMNAEMSLFDVVMS